MCEQFGFVIHRRAVGAVYHVLVLFLNSDVIETEEREVGSGSREKQAGREKMGDIGGVKEGDDDGKRQREGGEQQDKVGKLRTENMRGGVGGGT